MRPSLGRDQRTRTALGEDIGGVHRVPVRVPRESAAGADRPAPGLAGPAADGAAVADGVLRELLYVDLVLEMPAAVAQISQVLAAGDFNQARRRDQTRVRPTSRNACGPTPRWGSQVPCVQTTSRRCTGRTTNAPPTGPWGRLFALGYIRGLQQAVYGK